MPTPELINILNTKVEDKGFVKLVFKRGCLGMSFDDLQKMPHVKSLGFEDTSIHNSEIFQFDHWWENITELAFIRTKFCKREYGSEYFPTEKNFPTIKKLVFNYAESMDGLHKFLKELNEKFPSLESLRLSLDVDIYNDPNHMYYPMYFKNLKKLDLVEYGEKYERIFNYMDIWDGKLKELSLNTVELTTEDLQWINNCENLHTLSLVLPNLNHNKVNRLMYMNGVATLNLKTTHFYCKAIDLIKLARSIQSLTLLTVHLPQDTQLKFDAKFEEMFGEVVEDRGQLMIMVVIGEGVGRIEMMMWGNDLSKSTISNESTSDEESDASMSDEESDASTSYEESDAEQPTMMSLL